MPIKLANLLKTHLRGGRVKELQELLRQTHSTDIVKLFPYLSLEHKRGIFDLLTTEEAISLLREVDVRREKKFLESLNDKRLVRLLEKLPPDKRTDILKVLSSEKKEKVFSFMEAEPRQEARELLHYQDNTAGGIMTSDFLVVREDVTVREAMRKLRATPKTEVPFWAYVVNERRELVGLVSLRKLVIAQPMARIKELMLGDIVSVTTSTDQEEVARIVAKYNLLSIPVVDEKKCPVGIITVDDIINIIEQAATEDMFRMAGTHRDEMISRSVLHIAKVRLPWLFAAWIGGLVSLFLIGYFEPTLSKIVALAAFIPVVLGMGGNAGVQTLTVVVRGLAIGQIDVNELGRVVFREVRVGIILGLTYGVLLAIFSLLRFRGSEHIPELGLVVGLGICGSMFIATLIGASVPLLLKRLGVDPAVSTGPFVTTAIDILGVGWYFIMATILLF